MVGLDVNLDSSLIDSRDAAIWWIRRDLRLADNQALAAALLHSGRVLPVFVLDPALVASPYAGEKRLAFLWAGLRELDADLRRRGSSLTVRPGSPTRTLEQLVRESGASVIYAEADYSPYARHRDREVGERLPLRLVDGLTVHPPQAVLKKNGTPYTVFTPYRRKWSELSLPSVQAVLPAPDSIGGVPGLESDPIPAAPALGSRVPFVPGEQEAARRLQGFVDREHSPIYRYGHLRDRLDVSGTARLSPYLRFGMLSARQAVISAVTAIAAAPDERALSNAESWLRELIWREFYISILYHFPAVRRASFRPELRDIRWSNDESVFRAWCEGRTGYPVVDAGMRQLSETGWMPNRARMIVASFLVKDLLIDWRWGERWFMRHLMDGDPAANNGGWQWTAGTGTDAAPYFRIFNPVTQAKRHDPDGTYVRRWVPELARVPQKMVHEPWRMDEETQQRAGCVIGRDYPAPIVEHAWARDRVLAAYAAARRSGS
jgi:deoxyribodipyrimidine photo-lyase